MCATRAGVHRAVREHTRQAADVIIALDGNAAYAAQSRAFVELFAAVSNEKAGPRSRRKFPACDRWSPSWASRASFGGVASPPPS